MKVFVVAGEASGDKLGAALMVGLKQLTPDVEFRGIGGAAMQQAGLSSLFAMAELSLMGIVEILPKYFHLKRRIRETAAAILEWQPDVIVTIDAPDFSLRCAKLVKQHSKVPIVHYVAPSVWAWRPKRAQKMARVVDHVLALLPFEPPLMVEAGMDASFVGHPVVAEPLARAQDADAFRRQHDAENCKLLLVLPGSRRGEIARLGPIFGAVLARLAAQDADMRVVVPVAQNVEDQVREMVKTWPGAPVLIAPGDADMKRAAFKAADVALAASGTVALELAAAETPMVVAYDFNLLTRLIIRAMLKTDSVNLVNLVSETRIVPEFLGKNCRAKLIAPALADLLAAPDGQVQAMRLTMARLGQGGPAPGLRAAQVVRAVAGH